MAARFLMIDAAIIRQQMTPQHMVTWPRRAPAMISSSWLARLQLDSRVFKEARMVDICIDLHIKKYATLRPLISRTAARPAAGCWLFTMMPYSYINTRYCSFAYVRLRIELRMRHIYWYEDKAGCDAAACFYFCKIRSEQMIWHDLLYDAAAPVAVAAYIRSIFAIMRELPRLPAITQLSPDWQIRWWGWFSLSERNRLLCKMYSKYYRREDDIVHCAPLIRC